MIVDRLNQERAKADRPLVEPFGGPYPAQRAPEWDFIYDRFKVDILFDTYPPSVIKASEPLVSLPTLDEESREHLGEERDEPSANPVQDSTREGRSLAGTTLCTVFRYIASSL